VVINYAKQIKEENLESKFIEKNFVFDHRLGERITDDIVSKCHQCGKPVMYIPIASMKVVICCLFNVKNVHKRCKVAAHKTVDVIHLPEEEQKRSVGVNGNKIFKRKIRCIDF
jgi:UPF0176 protein